MSLKYLFNNGFDIILLCLYHSFEQPILSLYVFLKAFSVNYYINFGHLYPQPLFYRWKHLVRLTDSGHIANFLFYFYPNMLPLCHNVHFVISSGFYFTSFFLGMKSTNDTIEHPDICSSIQVIYTHINHTLPYMILLYSNTKQQYIFDEHTFFQTILWLYGWLFFIYFPWRYYTGDPVYSILGNQTSIFMKVTVIMIFHGLAFWGNEFGKFVQQNNQHMIYASFN